MGCQDSRVPAVHGHRKSEGPACSGRLDRTVCGAVLCAACRTNSFLGRFAIRLHLETQQPRFRFLRLIHVRLVSLPSRRCYFEKIDGKKCKASTILVDLGLFLARAVSISRSTAGDDHSARERTAEVLRSFLQVLLTPGLNHDIDAICRDQLGLSATQASIGFHRFLLWSPSTQGLYSDLI
jgi:hypothetical protein